MPVPFCADILVEVVLSSWHPILPVNVRLYFLVLNPFMVNQGGLVVHTMLMVHYILVLLDGHWFRHIILELMPPCL